MITTKRLTIAPWASEQAEAFYQLTCDDGFNAHSITIYRQKDLAAARQWILEMEELFQRTGLGKYGIWERSTGDLIGMGGLTPWVWAGEDLVDLTYRLRTSAWGKGIGSEAAQALLAHGRDTLKLRGLTATIPPDNTGSKKIAERLGMAFDTRIMLKNVPTDLYRLGPSSR